MASSVIQKLRGLADSGQNTQLQIQLRDAVRSGQINKQQANKLFADLVPRATKNQKPPEPLSPSELSNLSHQTHPTCLLYTSPSPRDRQKSRMPSSA